MIERRFGDRDVLFDYDCDCEYDYEYRLSPEYEYGVADVHRVRVLKTDSKTQGSAQRDRTAYGLPGTAPALTSPALQIAYQSRSNPVVRPSPNGCRQPDQGIDFLRQLAVDRQGAKEDTTRGFFPRTSNEPSQTVSPSEIRLPSHNNP